MKCKFTISATGDSFTREVSAIPRMGETVNLINENGKQTLFEVREVNWDIFSPWDESYTDSPINVEIKLRVRTQIDH